LTLTL